MTTIKDVAEKAGVSTATVSKIMNGNDQYISSATREKVKSIMKDLNYVPNAVAKGLKIRRTKTIGFILPDIRNPFFPEIARGIEDASWAKNFSVTFCNTDNDSKREAEVLKLLQAKMVDGIIVTRSMISNIADNIASCNLPVVVVDRKRETKSKKVGEIVIDAYSAFYEITNHLISRGCKKFAYISANGNSDDERYDGFKKALDDNHIDFDKNNIYRGGYDIETGNKGAEVILDREIPDAIVCGNDLIAVGAIETLKQKQIEVPNRVKITGFDDIYLSKFINPSLTTVKQPAYEMGFEAATMLINNILENIPLHVKKLDYQFIARESTK